MIIIIINSHYHYDHHDYCYHYHYIQQYIILCNYTGDVHHLIYISKIQ